VRARCRDARPGRVRVVRRSSTTFGGVLGGLLLLTGGILIPIGLANDPDPDEQTEAAAALGVEVTVTRVIDGDTLEVRRDDGVTGRVRLIGINSPELAHDGEPAQCGAEMARDLLRPLQDQRIRIVQANQATTDKYDRTLAYAPHDGLDVGAQQIAAGAAREYTYGSSLYGQRSEYVRLENYARAQEKGLWGAC